jgi:hypothetical protein
MSFKLDIIDPQVLVEEEMTSDLTQAWASEEEKPGPRSCQNFVNKFLGYQKWTWSHKKYWSI